MRTNKKDRNPPTFTQIRVTVEDAERVDELGLIIGKQRGGTWYRPDVLRLAVDLLEKEVEAVK